MNKTFLKSVLLGTLVVVCICGCGKSTADYIEAKETLEADTAVSGVEQDTENTEKVEENQSKKELLYVYVCGAIEHPGVYSLPEGSRVCDVFDLAGGLTSNASTDYWNQARVLADGEMIYVPTLEEVETRNLTQDVSGVSLQDTDDSNQNKININTASKEQLMTIPGIGEAKASAIISYRQENGKFSSIEEIKNVEGIKDGVYAKMKEYIVIN